jgi:hypothetical protein
MMRLLIGVLCVTIHADAFAETLTTWIEMQTVSDIKSVTKEEAAAARAVISSLSSEYAESLEEYKDTNDDRYIPSVLIALRDLNGDGLTDIIGFISSDYVCGGETHGCPIVVLIKKPDGTFMQALDGKAHPEGVGITDSGELVIRISTKTTRDEYFKWNGKKYEYSRTVALTPKNSP